MANYLHGFSIYIVQWGFNLRTSNTESLLRLDVEFRNQIEQRDIKQSS